MRLDVVRRELAQGAETITSLVVGVSPEEARARPEVLLLLVLVLHRPGEVWTRIDPAAWVTEREYNARDLARTLQAFLAERERSLAWLGSLSAPDWSREYRPASGPAPAGGPITAGDLLASWAAHDLLHTRQLLELRRARLLAHTAPHRTRYAGDW